MVAPARVVALANARKALQVNTQVVRGPSTRLALRQADSRAQVLEAPAVRADVPALASGLGLVVHGPVDLASGPADLALAQVRLRLRVRLRVHSVVPGSRADAAASSIPRPRKVR